MMRVTHNPVGDRNTGAGYGTTKTKSSGMVYPTQATYPYHEKREPIFDFDEDDKMQADLVLSKIDGSTQARSATTGRTDRGTLVKGRFYLQESMKDDDIMDGMIPYPFTTLYRHFSGPAVGGFRTDKAYTTRPGKNLKSTVRGWSQAQNFNPVGDKLEIHNLQDLTDPSIRSLAKANLMIKLAKEDSE